MALSLCYPEWGVFSRLLAVTELVLRPFSCVSRWVVFHWLHVSPFLHANDCAVSESAFKISPFLKVIVNDWEAGVAVRTACSWLVFWSMAIVSTMFTSRFLVIWSGFHAALIELFAWGLPRPKFSSGSASLATFPVIVCANCGTSVFRPQPTVQSFTPILGAADLIITIVFQGSEQIHCQKHVLFMDVWRFLGKFATSSVKPKPSGCDFPLLATLYVATDHFTLSQR